MKLLTRSGAQAWCDVCRIPLSDDGLPDVRNSEHSFSIPEDPGQRVGLVKDQMGIFSQETEILVWLDDWGVWPSGQWDHIFSRFRASYGYDSQLIDYPAHHLEGSEIEIATSIAIYSILMLWDCYVLSSTGAALYYSHDEFGSTNRP